MIREEEEMFVNNWERDNHSFRKQDARKTTYSAGVIENEILFQIQTYGIQGISSGPKQIIQFDKQRALELIEILKKEFSIEED